MEDKDFELLIRIAGNLEGISTALIESNPPIANWLCDMSEWLDGIIDRVRLK